MPTNPNQKGAEMPTNPEKMSRTQIFFYDNVKEDLVLTNFKSLLEYTERRIIDSSYDVLKGAHIAPGFLEFAAAYCKFANAQGGRFRKPLTIKVYAVPPVLAYALKNENAPVFTIWGRSVWIYTALKGSKKRPWDDASFKRAAVEVRTGRAAKRFKAAREQAAEIRRIKQAETAEKEELERCLESIKTRYRGVEERLQIAQQERARLCEEESACRKKLEAISFP